MEEYLRSFSSNVTERALFLRALFFMWRPRACWPTIGCSSSPSSAIAASHLLFCVFPFRLLKILITTPICKSCCAPYHGPSCVWCFVGWAGREPSPSKWANIWRSLEFFFYFFLFFRRWLEFWKDLKQKSVSTSRLVTKIKFKIIFRGICNNGPNDDNGMRLVGFLKFVPLVESMKLHFRFSTLFHWWEWRFLVHLMGFLFPVLFTKS